VNFNALPNLWSLLALIIIIIMFNQLSLRDAIWSLAWSMLLIPASWLLWLIIIICVFLARETDPSKVEFSNGWFGVSVLSAGHNDAVWVCYFLESMNIIIVSDAEERTLNIYYFMFWIAVMKQRLRYCKHLTDQTLITQTVFVQPLFLQANTRNYFVAFIEVKTLKWLIPS